MGSSRRWLLNHATHSSVASYCLIGRWNQLVVATPLVEEVFHGTTGGIDASADVAERECCWLVGGDAHADLVARRCIALSHATACPG